MLEKIAWNRPTIAAVPCNNRSAITNKPRRMVISGRSALGRRIRDLADTYAVQLGGWAALTDAQVSAVRRAAELSAISEQARADALRNGCADPLALVRLEGVADRAVRGLGLRPGATSGGGRRRTLRLAAP